MLTTAQRATIVPPNPPSLPRLFVAPTRAGRAVLDCGWWPRSWDPVAELPGLVLALAARYGPIRQLMLNSVTWERRFRRLAVGEGVVRMGWFASLDPAQLIAITARGEQLDLLVVPPGTAASAAKRAMAMASDPTNTMRAPHILAAMSAAGNGTDQGAARDNDRDGTAQRGTRRLSDELSTVQPS